MIINLEKLLKRETDILDLNFSRKIDNISYCGESLKLTTLINLNGTISNTKAGIYLDCNVDFSVLSKCNRCLSDIQVNIDSNFQGFLVSDENKVLEDDDTFVYNGDEFDFKDIIESAYILNAPLSLLCKDNCKGLCVSCGANLNETECDCNNLNEEDSTDPRFSKLKELFKND